MHCLDRTPPVEFEARYYRSGSGHQDGGTPVTECAWKPGWFISILNYATDVKGACYQADITLVLTAWDEFRNLVPSEIENVARGQRIIDGRNCLERAKWRNAGSEYRGMGRS